ncbi:glycerophosphodiester phosphodiesterase family protein [Corynebacterium macginleyi]|uniref:glycerophosphodiester phosphodiesterase family protein n=1 Tax=Corynebacterium macginleyi TaxID=38290 RepID=UPI0019092FFB|nr:glycerophosphodiester phosphodiesterase family protein [Corynebacterium macginleyi]MBK4148712.1 glycerophosphodiester phosphodiesterase [Corynebacterium macginleyi]MBK4159516.1 glycerophosphodiester phosphodiesterase [Corynebacterium macginleyi]MBK4178047.1 glycerophosphodiester phosphodiesterase [Corynebacterium macginleyi]
MHIVAHRGYSGKYPELSPLAFEKAMELPIHGVECDVRLSRDGKVVIQHDPTLERTAGRAGRVSAMDWRELSEVDIGKGQRMMLLDDLLAMLGDKPHHLYIETKHPSGHGSALEKRVMERLRAAGLDEDPRMHVISFSHKAIRRMKILAPHIDRIYLRRDWERHVNRSDFIWSEPSALGVSLLRAKMQVAIIGAQGLPTYMWTVDKPEDMKWAWSNGVDMLATNQPEVALRAIEL